MCSDHYPIATLVNVPPDKFKRFSYKINHSKVDWDAFQGYLKVNENLINNTPNSMSPQLKYESLIDVIMSAIQASSPKPKDSSKYFNKRNRRSSPSAPWWNENCSHAVALRRKATSLFRKSGKKSSGLKTARHIPPQISLIKTMNLPIKCGVSSPTSVPNFRPTTSPPLPPAIPCQSNLFLQKELSPHELKHALSVTNSTSPSGLDKIDYFVLKKLPNSYKNCLLDIFNSLLNSGPFPDSWRKFLVFLLPKNTPDKFRPIALASCTLKHLEKLIANRLMWWLETEQVLPNNQFGFRKLRSCADNLSILSTEILTGFASKQFTPCVFIDIKGAFDNVNPLTLYNDLARIGIPQKLADFVYVLLALRQLYFVSPDELNGPYPMDKGAGQGLVLSPILFNIYTSFLAQLHQFQAESIFFADDLVIFSRNSNVSSSLESVEEATNSIANHLSDRNLEISPEKSHLIIFSKKHFIPSDYYISINDTLIHAEETPRFLGVTLDFRFSFSPHISALTTHPNKLITFYRGLIRSSIEYGSHILRYMAKCFSQSLHPALDKLASLYSILSRKNSNIHNIKTDFPIYRSYTKLLEHKHRIHSHSLATPYEFQFSLINSPPLINTSIGHSLKNAKNNLDLHTQIYTDGSKTHEGSYVGFAVVVSSKDIVIKHKITSYASIFTAEALALLTSLQTIHSLKIERSVILSDSLSVLTALSHLSNQKSSSRIVYEILELYSNLSLNGYHISLIWIPFHAGIPGNELADRHAKEPTTNGICHNTCIPHSEFRESLSRSLKAKTAKLLRTQSIRKGSLYFKHFYNGFHPPWFHSLGIDRSQISSISSMRSNEILFRKNIVNSPLCECHLPETLSYIFWFCPLYTNERTPFVKALKKLKISSFNIQKLISHPSTKVAFLIHNYLKSIHKSV
ncbi:uncharacterized protein LOC135161040 [Diachasmimorpha longicaudata]|uniref:uncharacterized protein LOC135161040 n=1 Tax=Diachasmimorpha longicaudata TaxID=58733 RepID=UPI0030B913DB